MKKLLYSLLFVAIYSTSSFAQHEIGFKMGLNFANTSITGIAPSLKPNQDFIQGFTGGISYRMPLDQNFNLVSGIHYKRKGTIIQENTNIDIFGLDFPVGAKLTTSLDYFEVPLLFEYVFDGNSGIQPYISLGPSIGYASYGEARTSANFIFDITVNRSDLALNSKSYNRWDLSGQVAGGIRVPYGAGSFDFGMSYTRAFNTFLNMETINVQARNFGIGAHIGFNVALNKNKKRNRIIT